MTDLYSRNLVTGEDVLHTLIPTPPSPSTHISSHLHPSNQSFNHQPNHCIIVNSFYPLRYNKASRPSHVTIVTIVTRKILPPPPLLLLLLLTSAAMPVLPIPTTMVSTTIAGKIITTISTTTTTTTTRAGAETGTGIRTRKRASISTSIRTGTGTGPGMMMMKRPVKGHLRHPLS